MRLKFTIILATVLALVGLMAMPAAAQDKAVVQRDLGDAFVDTFFLEDVALIRAQMPFNTADPVTSLIAGMRVDNIDAAAAGGPYATLEEMLQAFYNSQLAFNNDPSRNPIEMHGTVREVTQEDGTVLVMANIVYTNLPLSLYELDSWDNALWEECDPAQAVKVLEDGFMNARVYVEMEIPSQGAPLHFWDSSRS